MADEKILIRLEIDKGSERTAENAFRAFRERAQKLLKLNVTIPITQVRKRLNTIRNTIRRFKPRINEELTFKVKLEVDGGLITTLRTAFKDMSVAGKELSRNVDALSKKFAKLRTSMRTVASTSKTVVTGFKEGSTRARSFGQATDRMTSSFFGFIAAAATGERIVRSVVENFSEFETRLVRVGRLVNSAGSDLNVLGQELAGVANELGVATNEVLELAEAGARLGIARDDITAFTRQVQQIAIALQITGQEAAESFKSLSLLFKIPINQIINIGNAINGIADASSVSAQELQRVVTFLAPTLAQFEQFGQVGLGAATALGAVLKELGVSAEVASSGTLRLFRTIVDQAPEAARVAGLPVAEFEKLLQLDLTAALGRFAEGFAKLDTQTKLTTQSLLGLNNIRVSRVLALLANNFDRVREKQELANREFESGVSVLQEVERQQNTLGIELTKLGNEIAAVAREGFAPLAVELRELIKEIRRFIDRNREWLKSWVPLVVQGAAIVGILGALGTALFVFTQLGTAVVATFKALGAGLVGLNTLLGGTAAAAGTAAGTTAGLSATLGALFAGLGKLLLILGSVLAVFAAAESGIAQFGDTLGTIPAIFAGIGREIERGVAIMHKWLGVLDESEPRVKQMLDLGPITDFNRKMGDLINFFRGERGFNQSMAFVVKTTKDADVATRSFTDGIQEMNKFMAETGNETAKTTAAIDAFRKISSETLASLVAKLKDGRININEFYAALADEEQLEAFITLTARGGQALRDIVDKTLQDIAQGYDDVNKAAEAQAATLKTFVEEFNLVIGNIDARRKISVDIDAENFNIRAAELNQQIAEVLAKAEQGDAVFTAVETSLIQVYKSLLQNIEGVERMRDIVTEIRDEWSLTDASAARTVATFSKVPGLIESMVDRTSEVRQNIEAAFGGGPEGLQRLDDLTRRVLNMRDRFEEAFAGLDLREALKTGETTAALDVIRNLNAQQIIQLEQLVSVKEEEAELERLISDNRAESARADREGLKNIDRQIKKQRELVRALKEGRVGAQDVAAKRDIEIAEEKINELLEERSKFTRDDLEAEERRAKVEEDVARFIAKGTRNLEKQLGVFDDVDGKLREIVEKEKEQLRLIEQKALSEQQLIRVRVQSARNIAAAEARIRQEQFNAAQKQAEQSRRNLERIEAAGEEFLRRQELRLEPSTIIRDIRQIEAEFTRAALAGFTPEQQERARRLFTQLIERTRQEGIESAAENEEQLAERREELERRISDLRRDLLRGEITAQQERQLAREERERLRSEGVRGSLLERGVADFVSRLREEQDDTARELSRAQNELADVNAEIEESRRGATEETSRAAEVSRDAAQSLEEAFSIGEAKMVAARKEAEKASNALINAATALERSAIALARASGQVAVEQETQRLIREREAQAAQEVEKLGAARVETETFADSLDGFRSDVAELTSVASAATVGLRRDALRFRQLQGELAANEAKLNSETAGLKEEEKKTLKQRNDIIRKDLENLDTFNRAFTAIEKEADRIRANTLAKFKEAAEEAEAKGAQLPADLVEQVSVLLDKITPSAVAGGALEAEIKSSIDKITQSLRDFAGTLDAQADKVRTEAAKAATELRDTAGKQIQEQSAASARALKDVGTALTETVAVPEQVQDTIVAAKKARAEEQARQVTDTRTSPFVEELTQEADAFKREFFSRLIDVVKAQTAQQRAITEGAGGFAEQLDLTVIEQEYQSFIESVPANLRFLFENIRRQLEDVGFAAEQEDLRGGVIDSIENMKLRQIEFINTMFDAVVKGFDRADTTDVEAAAQTEAERAAGLAPVEAGVPAEVRVSTAQQEETKTDIREAVKEGTIEGQREAARESDVGGAPQTETFSRVVDALGILRGTLLTQTETLNTTLTARFGTLDGLFQINNNALEAMRQTLTNIDTKMPTNLASLLSGAEAAKLTAATGAEGTAAGTEAANAVANLTEATGGFVGASAERTAELTQQANERTADINAAAELLSSTQLET